jgi:(1->4)-alpha-D-glucan 1-alpha-D-glucosylmutase
MQAYMEKATHEAKVHTSWINPNLEYDTAVRDFVAALLDEHPKNRFLAEFVRFHEQVVNWGLYSALAQTLLKLTSPGVPDLYQGQESWDFSLVDPDNRRPVDSRRHREMLLQIQKDLAQGDSSLLTLARELAHNPRDGRLKLFLTWRTLQFRRRHAALFQSGDYVPLEAQGTRARHVCAFARCSTSVGESERPMAIIVVPRWIAQLTPLPPDALVAPPPMEDAVWEDTRLAVGPWASSPLKNLFTGEIYSADESLLWVGKVLSNFPVALLSNVD